MIISVRLTDFRNFKSKSLEFAKGITVIVGPNASGKTNILESVYLLSTGKSFKARLEGEMLAYGQELARISGAISSMPHVVGSEDHEAYSIKHNTKLEVVITTGDNGWPKKKLTLNGTPKRMIDFAGNFKTVLFGPWDMDLVTESPSIRRKFLDSVLSQADREYRRSIMSYEKGLRQRNRLLWRIREEGLSRSQLLFWDQLLIKNGNYITEKREEFIEFVNSVDRLQTTDYGHKIADYSLEYDKSVISEGRLEQYKDEEVAAATTLVGPHRDDMNFKISNDKKANAKSDYRNLSAFGSRGEQRMGVLWLKMAELDYIEAKSEGPETSSGQAISGQVNSERPTLLLDDIFSELDDEHRNIVMDLAKKQQTITTTADEHYLKGLKDFELIAIN